jgi:hypothetical protein
MTIGLHFEQVIAVDLDEAWHSLHHDLPLLPLGLPNVRHIRELGREPSLGGQTRIDYLWGIEHTVVPSVARPFLKDLLDEVRSDTLWHHPQRRGEFLFYTESLRELFSCEGYFLLDSAGSGTRMQIIADLNVTPHELPGVPKLLSRSIIPAVERVVRDTISPSLEALPGALDQLIRERHR